MLVFFSRVIYIYKDSWYFTFFFITYDVICGCVFWQDTFYNSINNILRITVPRCKFLYQLEFFWKVFFWTYVLCSISKWPDPGRFSFPQNKGVHVNVLPSVCVFWKIDKPLGHVSKSMKCGVSFSNLSTINLILWSNQLNAFNTLSLSWHLTSNNV